MKTVLLWSAFAGLTCSYASAQSLLPIVIEAEAATRGSSWNQAIANGVTYITTSVNAAGEAPGDAQRVATLQVTFPEAGAWQVYARVWVGSGGFNDDSMFLASATGQPDLGTSNQWVMVNGLAAAMGYNNSADYVLDQGLVSTQNWKWVNMSRAGSGNPPNYQIAPDGLSQVIQFASREDGLRIDKFAFGREGVFFTVGNLDSGTAGTLDDPTEVFIPDGPPLATGKQKFLGNIHSNSQAGGSFEEHFLAYWNQVTPETAGKWGSVEATRDEMSWGQLDAAYDFARNHGMPFRFHVLVWGQQQPGWITSLSQEEQLEEITEWFDAVAARYPDSDYVEVVNEAVPGHAPAEYREALGGAGSTGIDWIVTAFRMARDRFPHSKLVLNDYNILGAQSNTLQYRQMVSVLQAEGLIDVIGIQGHAFGTTASAATLQANLDLLAETGLPIMITEMDIDSAPQNGTPDDQVQLASYQRIFPVFWEHPSVIGITLWGYRPGMWRDPWGAYLTLDNGTERPAMQWLREYVAQTELPSWLEEFPILNHWAMTGGWFGDAVYVRHHPWVWGSAGWMWTEQETVTENGGWFYIVAPVGQDD